MVFQNTCQNHCRIQKTFRQNISSPSIRGNSYFTYGSLYDAHKKEAQGFHLMLLLVILLLEDDLVLISKTKLALGNIFIIFTGLHVLLKIIDL